MSRTADELAERALYLPHPLSDLLARAARELRSAEKTTLIVREGSGIVAVCPSCAEPRAAKACPGPLCDGKVHPLEDFPRDRTRKLGRSPYCRECWAEIRKRSA